MMANPFHTLYLAEVSKTKFDLEVRRQAGWSERQSHFFHSLSVIASLVDESSGSVILTVICAIFQSVRVSC